MSRGDFSLAVDLCLPASGISVVFGPSGSGKTTLMRAIAGLEAAVRGRVSMAGQVWQDDACGVQLPAWRRGIGYVFQEASLFDHLDVADNIAYGLRWLADAGAARAAVPGLHALLGLETLLRRRVDSLSGGERQRVAIARALAVQPSLLLLDEPLAALDFARRDEIMGWLETLRERTGTPMIYVTHSLEELARLADRAVVVVGGRVAACGEPAQALLEAGLGGAAERLSRLRPG